MYLFEYAVQFPAGFWGCMPTLPAQLQLQSELFNPHCTLGLLAKYTISQLFAINQLHKNCLSSLMKLILQGFYPNSTQNDTFNDFNEFTAVSKLFNPFMTRIFST